MAYNTKNIKTDYGSKPIPQHFNASADDYEATQGADGKQFVRASELEDLIGALAAAAVADPEASASVIQALKGILTDLGQTSDAAVAAGAVGSLSAKIRRLTTDLDALLTKVGEVQASPTANTILARLKDLKDGMVLTGSVESVSITTTTVSTTVNAAANEVTTVYAPSGKISKIQGVGFNAPAVPSSGSGTHQVDVYLMVNSTLALLATKSAAYNASLNWTFAESITAGLVGKEIDADTGILIKYTNSTNANQTDARTIRFASTDRKVVAG